ncbi:hypothetical protein ES703_39998 [subsurface metagenome]
MRILPIGCETSVIRREYPLRYCCFLSESFEVFIPERIAMKIRGFTLVELLVVIAIIAILMAILMPSLKLAKDQAYAVVCVSNLRNLSLAWFVYADENDGQLVNGHIPMDNNPPRVYWVLAPQDPAGNYTGGSNPTVEDKLRGIRRGKLFPYVKDVDVYHCPNDRRKRDPTQNAFRSYSMAGGVNGERGFGAVPVEMLDEIKQPGSKYVFVEESDNRGWNIGSWVVNPNNEDSWVDPLAIWHNKRSTLGFADGHAEKHRWLDERTVKFAEDWSTDPHQPGNPDLEYMLRGYIYRELD